MTDPSGAEYGPPPPPPEYGPPPPPGYGPPPPPYGAPPPGYGPPPPPYGAPPPPNWGNDGLPGGWSVSGPALPAWALPPPMLKGGNEKTGPLPLHPMSTSDILDGAIKLLRANVKTMVLIVAAFIVPFEFLIAFLERNLNGGNSYLDVLRDPTAGSQSSGSASLALIVTYVSFWVVVPIICAGASRVVMASYLGGEMEAKDAIRAAFKLAPTLLVASLLVHLGEMVAALGLLVGALFVMPLFIMTAPAISLEDLGPWAGIRRSVSLARRRYWPTVGIALLSGLLAYFLNQVLGLVPRTVALLIGLRWGWIIIAFTGTLEAFVSVSLITIIATLVYLDARIRQEGFDLEVMASRLEPR